MSEKWGPDTRVWLSKHAEVTVGVLLTVETAHTLHELLDQVTTAWRLPAPLQVQLSEVLEAIELAYESVGLKFRPAPRETAVQGVLS